MRKLRILLPFAVCVCLVAAYLLTPWLNDGAVVRAGDDDPLPQLERQMISLINQERGKRGLKPLAADPELTAVARRHSSDMLLRRYFSHINPEGQGPFERMRTAHVAYRSAAENIALAPTLEMAHTLLMGSQGHRENILFKGFGRLGVGIIDGGTRGIMICQEFRD